MLPPEALTVFLGIPFRLLTCVATDTCLFVLTENDETIIVLRHELRNATTRFSRSML